MVGWPLADPRAIGRGRPRLARPRPRKVHESIRILRCGKGIAVGWKASHEAARLFGRAVARPLAARTQQARIPVLGSVLFAKQQARRVRDFDPANARYRRSKQRFVALEYVRCYLQRSATWRGGAGPEPT